MHTYLYTLPYIRPSIHPSWHPCMHPCMLVCMHAYVHIYTHVYCLPPVGEHSLSPNSEFRENMLIFWSADFESSHCSVLYSEPFLWQNRPTLNPKPFSPTFPAAAVAACSSRAVPAVLHCCGPSWLQFSIQSIRSGTHLFLPS